MPRTVEKYALRSRFLERAIISAKDYNRELDRASSLSAKAKIHHACREALAHGSPGKVIEKSEEELDYIRRENEK